MSASSYIARRYLTSRNKRSAVGIITTMAVVGVAVSVFAMVVVMGVFAGLREINDASMNSVYPHIEISPTTGKTITVDESMTSAIEDV